MAQWVLSVAGIAILSVLADVILPVGQTRKYIKTVIGIVVTLVLVQPLFSFAGGGGFFAEQADIQPQTQYISYVEATQSEGVDSLVSELKKAGFDNPTVTYAAKTRNFIVNFTENYSQTLYAKAQKAADNAKCRYPVKFLWNNTEKL